MPTTEQVDKTGNNKTGKGGFGCHPENINPGGRPKNQESFTYWMNFFKNLTEDEFEDWGNGHEITVAAQLAWTRVKLAHTELKDFQEVANRTEGMPIQSTGIKIDGDSIGQLVGGAKLDATIARLESIRQDSDTGTDKNDN